MGVYLWLKLRSEPCSSWEEETGQEQKGEGGKHCGGAICTSGCRMRIQGSASMGAMASRVEQGGCFVGRGCQAGGHWVFLKNCSLGWNPRQPDKGWHGGVEGFLLPVVAMNGSPHRTLLLGLCSQVLSQGPLPFAHSTGSRILSQAFVSFTP